MRKIGIGFLKYLFNVDSFLKRLLEFFSPMIITSVRVDAQAKLKPAHDKNMTQFQSSVRDKNFSTTRVVFLWLIPG